MVGRASVIVGGRQMADDLREDLTYLLWISLTRMSEEELLRLCCLVGSLSNASAVENPSNPDREEQ